MEEKKKGKESKKRKASKEVTPKRDFRIVCNEHDIQLKKGEPCEVPEQFLVNLRTENVI